ncbi:MAG: succinate dehydrogenase, partial [Myxococcota bacterium]
VVVQHSMWIRAVVGGFLLFHVRRGYVAARDQPLATNTTLLGHARSVLTSPFNGIVVGMTTLPAVSPGEPVCNLGRLPKGTGPEKLIKLRSDEHGLEERMSEQLASNLMVVDPVEPE